MENYSFLILPITFLILSIVILYTVYHYKFKPIIDDIEKKLSDLDNIELDNNVKRLI